MAALKLLNLLALASVAVLTLSFGATPVNALATDNHMARRASHGHDAIAKRKRSSSTSRCKPRPSSSSSAAPSWTPSPSPSSTPPPPPPPPSTSSTQPSTTWAPAPSSSSSSAAPAPSSGGGNGSGKWGLGWPNGDSDYLTNFLLPDVKFLYTWGPQLPSNLNGLTGVAMLWGYDQISQFQQLVVAGYANYVLGMNEPNEPSQSNMSAQDGAQLWMQYIDPLHDQGYYLVSPACTNDAAGMQWMQDFFSACTGCHVDAVAFHYYSTSESGFATYATQLHNEFNLPIWVTEFADQNFSGGSQADQDDVWNFAGTIKQFVDETDWMEAAFPFGVMGDMQGVNTLNQLLSDSNEPTALASFYFGS